MRVHSETKPYDSINVTPMLDLAYVLLVIFIIMTTATVQGLHINMPKPSAKPKTEHKELRVVQILADGRVMLNGAGMTLAELESRLDALHAREPEMSLVIKGDPLVNYARVVDIIDLATKLNIGNVALATAKIGS